VKKNRFPLPQKTHYGAARLGDRKSKITQFIQRFGKISRSWRAV
jgi:hypothetical protein